MYIYIVCIYYQIAYIKVPTSFHNIANFFIVVKMPMLLKINYLKDPKRRKKLSTELLLNNY